MLSSSQAGMVGLCLQTGKIKPTQIKQQQKQTKTHTTPNNNTKQNNNQTPKQRTLKNSVLLWSPNCSLSISAAQNLKRWKQIWRCKHRIGDLSKTLRLGIGGSGCSHRYLLAEGKFL